MPKSSPRAFLPHCQSKSFEVMPKTDEQAAWIEALSTKTAKSDKNWHIVLILSVCFGWLGIDRIYVERPVLGLFKFLAFATGALAVPVHHDPAAFIIFGLGIFWWFLD